MDITTPKFYLIPANLTEEERERVRVALSVAPPIGAFCFSPEAAEFAKQLGAQPLAVTSEQPFAIIANFPPHTIGVIGSDGSTEILVEGTNDVETETGSEQRESAPVQVFSL